MSGQKHLPGLWPVPGDGVLARHGELILLSSLESGQFVDTLLDLLGQIATSGGDGRRFADAIADALEIEAMSGDPGADDAAEPGPSVLAFGPAGSGLAVTVAGQAWATVTTAHGTQRIEAGNPGTLMRCLLRSPATAVRGGLGAREDRGSHTDRFSRLDGGTVRAGGLGYYPGGAAYPGAGSGDAVAGSQLAAGSAGGLAGAGAAAGELAAGGAVAGGLMAGGAALDEALSAGSMSDDDMSDDAMSARSSSAVAGSDQASADAESFGLAGSGEAEPDQARSDQAWSGEAGSDQPGSDEAESDQARFDQAGFDQAGPDQAEPGEPASGAGPAPEGRGPADRLPTMAVPIPDGPVPDQLAAGGPGPAEPWPTALAYSPPGPAVEPSATALAYVPQSTGSAAEPWPTAAAESDVTAPPDESAGAVQWGNSPAGGAPGAAPQGWPAEATQLPPAVGNYAQDGPNVEGVYCENGHFGDPDAMFCTSCGVAIAQHAQARGPGQRPPLGTLVLDDGSVFQLDTDYIVGREPSLDSSVISGAARPLRVADDAGIVSRVHARVQLDGWRVLLTDLGSANGTRVKPPGQSVEQELLPQVPVLLAPGSEIDLGGRGLRYEPYRGQ
jgi:hypothetical protein